MLINSECVNCSNRKDCLDKFKVIVAFNGTCIKFEEKIEEYSDVYEYHYVFENDDRFELERYSN